MLSLKYFQSSIVDYCISSINYINLLKNNLQNNNFGLFFFNFNDC